MKKNDVKDNARIRYRIAMLISVTVTIRYTTHYCERSVARRVINALRRQQPVHRAHVLIMWGWWALEPISAKKGHLRMRIKWFFGESRDNRCFERLLKRVFRGLQFAKESSPAQRKKETEGIIGLVSSRLWSPADPNSAKAGMRNVQFGCWRKANSSGSDKHSRLLGKRKDAISCAKARFSFKTCQQPNHIGTFRKISHRHAATPLLANDYESPN